MKALGNGWVPAQAIAAWRELTWSEPEIVACGFDEALLYVLDGVAHYSMRKCVEVLMREDAMDECEALEFFNYNINGANVGSKTPVFVEDMPW